MVFSSFQCKSPTHAYRRTLCVSEEACCAYGLSVHMCMCGCLWCVEYDEVKAHATAAKRVSEVFCAFLVAMAKGVNSGTLQPRRPLSTASLSLLQEMFRIPQKCVELPVQVV